VLEKIESWCSQQVASCKIEVVALLGVGAHMYDNVKNVTITYHIKKMRFLPCMGFLGKYLSLCFSYMCD
jgi:hypothetical protein